MEALWRRWLEKCLGDESEMQTMATQAKIIEILYEKNKKNKSY